MPALSARHRALGQALRELRTARKLTQEALAERAGMSANYVGDAERGERNLSIRALWQLADGLGVPAFELLANSETNSNKEHQTS